MTPDLHPDDRAHVEAVAAELRGHRRRLELTAVEVAARIGTGRNAVRAAEVEPNRRTGTLQQYAYALGMRLVFHLDGLPDIVDPTAQTLARSARQAKDWRRSHSFERAALGARLGAIRRHLKLTQTELAGKLGRDPGFISHLEQGTADDPLLGNYQQAARTLGGMLRMRIVPDGSTDETRLLALLDELGDHSLVAAVRYRAATPIGTVKGLSLLDAQLAVAEHGGHVEQAELWLLPTRHKVLGPWLPYAENTPVSPAAN